MRRNTSNSRGKNLSDLKRVWKNDYFKTAVAIILIVAIVLGFLFGLQLVLHTADPALTVESGSMSIPYDSTDSFWLSMAHPFDRTLSIGDIIIIQGVNPKDLNTNYPNSDIIVFHSPDDYNMLIVHRIIGTVVVNGTTYYLTKGDGNGNPWPQTPTSGQDQWDNNNPPGVPSNYIVGKVVMRIPWFGWVTLFMRDNSWGLPVVIALIMLLIVIEFIVPILREKKPEQQNPMQPQSQMSL
jgi:signal peptidase I